MSDPPLPAAWISLYYVAFYAVMTGLFTLCIYVLMRTVDPYTPDYQDQLKSPGNRVARYQGHQVQGRWVKRPLGIGGGGGGAGLVPGHNDPAPGYATKSEQHPGRKPRAHEGLRATCGRPRASGVQRVWMAPPLPLMRPMTPDYKVCLRV